MEKPEGYVDIALIEQVKKMSLQDIVALRECCAMVMADRREAAVACLAACDEAGIAAPKPKRAPRSDKGRSRKGIGPAPEMGNVVDMGEIG
jgi:hypothetical protein